MAHLVRWEPFRDLISLREAMDRLFEESFIRPRAGWLAPLGAGALAVDMYETDQDVEKANYVRQERRYGAFSRSVTLPTTIVAEKAKAEFENGVLTLTLPKAEEVKPKAIKVKAK